MRDTLITQLMRGSAVSLVLAVSTLAMPAWAQETAPTAEPAAEATTQQVSEKFPTETVITPAIGDLNVEGNLRRFEQYVTPPEQAYIKLTGIRFLPIDGTTLLDLNANNIGGPSVSGNAWALLGNGTILARGTERRSDFYRDWDADSQQLTRKDDRTDLTVLGKASRLKFSYDNNSLRGGNGDSTENWLRNVPGVSYSRLVSDVLTNFTFNTENFSFREGPQFSGSTEVVGMRLSPLSLPRTSLEADGYISQTSVDERSNAPKKYHVGVEGVHELTGDLSLLGDVSHDELTRTFTQSAYARRNTSGKLFAEYRGVPHTVLDLGFGARRVAYVNNEQTTETDADENNVFARANARLAKNLTLKGSDSRWWTSNRPIAVDIFAGPIGSLVWSSKKEQRLDLAFTPGLRTGISANWRNLAWRNSDLGTHNGIVEHGLSAWWIPDDSLTLYANYLRQNFRISGVGADAPYLTDDETFVIGATTQLSNRLSLDTAYTTVNCSGAADSTNDVWSVGMNYRWNSGDHLSLYYALDDFNAVDALQNYDANRFELSYTKVAF